MEQKQKYLILPSENLPINEEEKGLELYSNSQPTAESWEFENTKAL